MCFVSFHHPFLRVHSIPGKLFQLTSSHPSHAVSFIWGKKQYRLTVPPCPASHRAVFMCSVLANWNKSSSFFLPWKSSSFSCRDKPPKSECFIHLVRTTPFFPAHFHIDQSLSRLALMSHGCVCRRPVAWSSLSTSLKFKFLKVRTINIIVL